MNRVKTQPLFIGIGAQKCASTWIYDILSDHPDVVLSTVKELDFFSNFWDRGYRWYEEQFPAAADGKVLGEVSPLYFYDRDAPARIRDLRSDARLIVTFRNPLDRAYSNHKHNLRHGFTGGVRTFEDAMADNPSYLEFGLYGRYLKQWRDVFPEEQILVVFFDDIVRDPAAVASAVHRFLGISADHQSRFLTEKSNEAVAVSSVVLARLMDRLRTRFKGAGLAWAWDLMRKLGLRAVYRSFNMKKVDEVIPRMRPETRQSLADYYREDIALLSALTGRDLSHWLNKGSGG